MCIRDSYSFVAAGVVTILSEVVLLLVFAYYALSLIHI